jgi:hypothetical protein
MSELAREPEQLLMLGDHQSGNHCLYVYIACNLRVKARELPDPLRCTA